MSTTPPTTNTNDFGPTHTVAHSPQHAHSHTAILLHGRGSDGEEFAEELFDSKLSDKTTLAKRLPGWKWVFPSSRELHSTVFDVDMPAWFEAHSLTDITARQDLQMPGIRESVAYLGGIVEKEIADLGGDASKVILGGISLGGAIGLWTLFGLGGSVGGLGAFVGASTWLPFAQNVEGLFGGHAVGGGEGEGNGRARSEADVFVEEMTVELRRTLAHEQGRDQILLTPVFLGHGVDDAYVDVELGRQVKHVLGRIGMQRVEMREYSGAEQEGHWLKVPEEVDDIANFLVSRFGKEN